MPRATPTDLKNAHTNPWWLERPHDEEPKADEDKREHLERDRDRIVHARAFRRLSGKTQVIATRAFDFRNRLTHTHEVSQIGRSIARRYGVSEPLIEAACLGHDVGHPPFGHAGERRLNTLMAEYGGFDANAQTLRTFANLEIKSATRPGLNLTRATYWALLKYPYRRSGGAASAASPADLSKHHLAVTDQGTTVAVSRFLYDVDLDEPIGPHTSFATFGDWLGGGKLNADLAPQTRLNAPPTQTLACRIMDWADDVAYAIHDFEDAVQAGFITRHAIRRVREPLLAAVARDVGSHFQTSNDLEHAFSTWEREIDRELEAIQAAPDLEAALRPTTRKWFGQLVDATRIEAPSGPDECTTGYRVDVPRKSRVLVSMLKNLGFELLIRDERIVRYLRKGTIMLERSFGELMDDPQVVDDRVGQLMPRHIAETLQATDTTARARAVCDFLASMSEPGLSHFYGTLFETSEGSPLF